MKGRHRASGGPRWTISLRTGSGRHHKIRTTTEKSFLLRNGYAAALGAHAGAIAPPRRGVDAGQAPH